jgi:hypothetical protein
MVSMVVFTHMGVFAPEAAADQKEGEKPPADEEHIQLVIVDEAPAVVYKELHGAALFKRAVRKVQLAHACVLVYRETLLGLSLKKRTMFRIYLKTILLPLTAVLGIHLVPVSSPLAVGWDSRWLFIVAYGFSTGFCVLCGPTVWLWYAVFRECPSLTHPRVFLPAGAAAAVYCTTMLVANALCGIYPFPFAILLLFGPCYILACVWAWFGLVIPAATVAGELELVAKIRGPAFRLLCWPPVFVVIVSSFLFVFMALPAGGYWWIARTAMAASYPHTLAALSKRLGTAVAAVNHAKDHNLTAVCSLGPFVGQMCGALLFPKLSHPAILAVMFFNGQVVEWTPLVRAFRDKREAVANHLSTEDITARYNGGSSATLDFSTSESDVNRESIIAHQKAKVPPIHVRGIGVEGWDGTADGTGRYEDVDQLTKVFAEFGEVLDVSIRHRIQDDQNTSWALVHMKTQEEVDAVMSGAPQLESFTLTEYSSKQAMSSTGGMATIREDAQASAAFVRSRTISKIKALRAVPAFMGQRRATFFRQLGNTMSMIGFSAIFPALRHWSPNHMFYPVCSNIVTDDSFAQAQHFIVIALCMELCSIALSQTLSKRELHLDHIRDGFYLVKNNHAVVMYNLLFAITGALLILLQHSWAGLVNLDGSLVLL